MWLVEKLFARHPGGVRAAANPSSGRLHLEWMPGKCELEPFLRELCQFGYVAAPAGTVSGDHERRRLAARLGLCGAFALNTMGFSLPVYLGMPADFEFAALFKMIAFLSATLSMLVGGGYFMDRAWRALRAGSLHIDLPIALGLVSAYVGSIVGWALGSERLMYFDFVSIFVFLMLAGRYLQTSAVERNRRRLVRQQPVPEAVPRADGEGAPVGRAEILAGVEVPARTGPGAAGERCAGGGRGGFLAGVDSRRGGSGAVFGGGETAGGSDFTEPDTGGGGGERALGGLADREANRTLGQRSAGRRGWTGCCGSIWASCWWWVWRRWRSGGCAGDWLTGAQAMISIFVVSCPCALGVAIPLADDLAAAAMERLGVFTQNGDARGHGCGGCGG